MIRRATPASTFAHLALALGAAVNVGCESDADHLYRCEETHPALDVASISVLEDAATFATMHDALEVDTTAAASPAPTAGAAAGTTRRLTAVEVLVALPASIFDLFPDGAPLEVEVFDAPKPEGTPVVVRQAFSKAALTWEDTIIPAGQSTHEQAHKTAWWRFELPNGGLELSSETVIAGVAWPEESTVATLYFGASSGLPIGYSNYDRPCAKNWSIYPDWRTAGTNLPAWTWVSNGANAETQVGGADACSWPMLRVELKTETLSRSSCP